MEMEAASIHPNRLLDDMAVDRLGTGLWTTRKKSPRPLLSGVDYEMVSRHNPQTRWHQGRTHDLRIRAGRDHLMAPLSASKNARRGRRR